MTRFIVQFAIAMLVWCASGSAMAQFRVEVSGVGLTQVPIAVVAFRGDEQSPQKIAAIIAADLERSGQFRGVDSAGGLSEDTLTPTFST
ncbi:MAG: Tol-Pal system beta propeller repeat protein TolB, partial [Rhodoferax sp.]